MPESGGNKDTEAGATGVASGERKRRAGEGTCSSSSGGGGAVKTEGGQRKRRAGGGTGQELPGKVMVMVMAAADDAILIEQEQGMCATMRLHPRDEAVSDLCCVCLAVLWHCRGGARQRAEVGSQ